MNGDLIEPNCSVGTLSHQVHDDTIKELSETNQQLVTDARVCKATNESQRKSIMELEAFKKYAEMTPRILSERIIRLERALKVLSDRYVKIGGKL